MPLKCYVAVCISQWICNTRGTQVNMYKLCVKIKKKNSGNDAENESKI